MYDEYVSCQICAKEIPDQLVLLCSTCRKEIGGEWRELQKEYKEMYKEMYKEKYKEKRPYISDENIKFAIRRNNRK